MGRRRGVWAEGVERDQARQRAQLFGVEWARDEAATCRTFEASYETLAASYDKLRTFARNRGERWSDTYYARRERRAARTYRVRAEEYERYVAEQEPPGVLSRAALDGAES